MSRPGLEVCVAASGLRCISLCGALIALRDRHVVPEVVTGVSGGAWAAYSAYSDNYHDNYPLDVIKLMRDKVRDRGLRHYLPPYLGRTLPEYILRLGLRHCSDASYIKSIGVKHFYVGYTRLPWFKFETFDVLRIANQEQMLRVMWRSSALPFITHPGPHFEGAADGALRYVAFTSPLHSVQRWLFISDPPTINPFELKRWKFTRVFRIKSPLRSAFRASDAELEHSFRSGYEQGTELDVRAA